MPKCNIDCSSTPKSPSSDISASKTLYYRPANFKKGVNWGVLISFSKLASTTVSLDQKSAIVGTGARWVEVMTALDPYESVLLIWKFLP